MNFFELHIGDYEAATAHLSMLEDAAYMRMLRIYYRTEKPLPADVKQVCRLVRAQSKPERDAVQQVLQDFFRLEADGWHQVRCDEELQRYLEGEPEREAKKANEETRLKRHRQERAELFRILTQAGQHAPWNTKIEELRRLAAPFKAASATESETPAPPFPATAPATPATATHGNVSPLPTSHYPLPNEERERGGTPPPRPALAPAASPVPEPAAPSAGGLACKAMKAAGLPLGELNPSHPDLLRLLQAGVTPETFGATAAEGKAKGKARLAWVLATVEGRLRDAAAKGQAAPAAAASPAGPGPDAWARAPEGCQSMAVQLGVDGIRDAEHWPAFQARVIRAWRRNGCPEPTATRETA